MRPKSNLERQLNFESSYTPEPFSGCWLWDREILPNGYGRFYVSRTVKPYRETAHRFSYRIFKGDIPDGLCVLHKCDTKLCVNPDHLFLGTKGDNNRDASKKGRNSHGELQPMAKLTDRDAIQIRLKYKTGNFTQRQLAKMYGVAQYQIWALLNKRQWKHASAMPPEYGKVA